MTAGNDFRTRCFQIVHFVPKPIVALYLFERLSEKWKRKFNAWFSLTGIYLNRGDQHWTSPCMRCRCRWEDQFSCRQPKLSLEVKDTIYGILYWELVVSRGVRWRKHDFIFCRQVSSLHPSFSRACVREQSNIPRNTNTYVIFIPIFFYTKNSDVLLNGIAARLSTICR